MFQYNRIDIFEGIDSNETSNSHKCKVFHYLYYFKISCRLQPCVFDYFHGLLLKLIRVDDMAIVTVKRNYKDYRIRFWQRIKAQAVIKMRNADLSDKRGQR